MLGGRRGRERPGRDRVEWLPRRARGTIGAPTFPPELRQLPRQASRAGRPGGFTAACGLLCLALRGLVLPIDGIITPASGHLNQRTATS